jgi:hypothetical protein
MPRKQDKCNDTILTTIHRPIATGPLENVGMPRLITALQEMNASTDQIFEMRNSYDAGKIIQMIEYGRASSRVCRSINSHRGEFSMEG